ncbi:hypothetical protein K488DRAFT_57506, partial [Vararia minispora EC-137]
RSSDVISDNRVNVYEEGSDRLMWYKESFLTEDEIVEHVVDNASSTTLWTIHKPLRGWYIHLRAPSFPPKSFIAFAPVPPSSHHHVPAALFFSCRTLTRRPRFPGLAPPTSSETSAQPRMSIESDITLASVPDSSAHTYPPPPTPPAVFVSPPSPASVNAKLAQIPSQPPPSRPRLQLTTLVLAPHTQPPPADDGSFFSRVTRAFRNNAPALSNSFSLFPVLPPPQPSSQTQVLASPTSTAPLRQVQKQNKHPQLTGPLGARPVLVFRDTTPVFTVHQSSGVLELDLDEIRALGVDMAFWIAVALAYGEFLGDRDVSMNVDFLIDATDRSNRGIWPQLRIEDRLQYCMEIWSDTNLSRACRRVWALVSCGDVGIFQSENVRSGHGSR